VDQILTQKITNSLTNTIVIEKEIDLIIYKLYQLNYLEASIIEGNTSWMTKEAYEAFILTETEKKGA